MKLFFYFILIFLVNTNYLKAETINYSNGDKYVGNLKDGKPHGKGTYNFANGSFCKGTFKNGYFYECVFTKSKNNYSDQTLRLYYGNKLYYEVPNTWANVVQCKIDKKKQQVLKRVKIISRNWRKVENEDEYRFCVKQVIDREKTYKILAIPAVILIFGLIYLIFIYSRNKTVRNYNSTHKTKFKNYSEYKRHLEKVRIRKNKTSSKVDNGKEMLMSKVKRLKALYKNGTLSKAEFEKAKNKLLK